MEGTYEVLPRAETSKLSAMCEIQFFHRPGGGEGNSSKEKSKTKKSKTDFKKGPGVSFESKPGQSTPTATVKMKPGKAKRTARVNFGALYATPISQLSAHKCHRDRASSAGGGGGGLSGIFKGRFGHKGGKGHECHHGHTHGPLGALFGVARGLLRSYIHHDHHSDLFTDHRHNFHNLGRMHQHHNFRWSS